MQAIIFEISGLPGTSEADLLSAARAAITRRFDGVFGECLVIGREATHITASIECSSRVREELSMCGHVFMTCGDVIIDAGYHKNMVEGQHA